MERKRAEHGVGERLDDEPPVGVSQVRDNRNVLDHPEVRTADRPFYRFGEESSRHGRSRQIDRPVVAVPPKRSEGERHEHGSGGKVDPIRNPRME